MISRKFPYGYKYKDEFEKLEIVKGFEGGVIYLGVKEGVNYLIIDSGTLIEFLDPIEDKKTISEIVKVIQFDDVNEMKKYLEEHNGRHG